MNESMNPVVVMNKISLDVNWNTLEETSLNCSNDTDEKLSVNSTSKEIDTFCENIKDHPEKLPAVGLEKYCEVDAHLEQNSSIMEDAIDVSYKSKKKVSFNNQSSILYYSEDQTTSSLTTLEIDYINNSSDFSFENEKNTDASKISHTELSVESSHCSSSDVEVQQSYKELHKLRKNVVVTLEKLPISVSEEFESENFVSDECSNSNFDKSQTKRQTESTDDISQSLDFQNLDHDVCSSKTSITDSLMKENKCFFPELKVSLKRLPDNLLELHQTSLSSQNFEELIHSESPKCSNSESRLEDAISNERFNFSEISSIEVLEPSEEMLLGNIYDYSETVKLHSKTLKRKKVKKKAVRRTYHKIVSKNSLRKNDLDEVLSTKQLPHELNCCDITVKDSHAHASNSIPSITSDERHQLQENCAKELKFIDCHRLSTEKEKFSSDTCCGMKNPFVQLERLNLEIPEVEDMQQAKPLRDLKKSSDLHRQDNTSDNVIQQVSHKFQTSVKNNSYSHTELNEILITSSSKKELKTSQFEEYMSYKHKSSLFHQEETSDKQVRPKSHLQKGNGGFVVDDTLMKIKLKDLSSAISSSGNLPSSKLVEINSADSVTFASNTKMHLRLHKNKFLCQTFGNSSQDYLSLQKTKINGINLSTSTEITQLESSNLKNNIFASCEDELPLSDLSTTVSDNLSTCSLSYRNIAIENSGNVSHISTSEDDVPLSELVKWSNKKKPNVCLFTNKVKNYVHNNSNAVQKNKFADLKQLDMSERSDLDILSLTSEANKELQKTSTPKMNRTEKSTPRKEMILLSNLAYMKCPDHLALQTEVEKDEKSSECRKTQKTETEKHRSKEEILLPPHLTNLNYVESSAVVTNVNEKGKFPNCDGNSSNSKSISRDYNYDFSCSFYRAKTNNLPTDSVEIIGACSEISETKTSSKKSSRKKKDECCMCTCKKRKTSDDPHVFLKTYLEKFCSDFDDLGKSKNKNKNLRSTTVSKANEKEKSKKESARKRKEDAYKLIIRKLKDHLKKTCPVKKSYKKQKANSVINACGKSPVQLPVTKVKSEGNSTILHLNLRNKNIKAENGYLSEQSLQPIQSKMQAANNRDSLQRKAKTKEMCKSDKYHLGILTGNKSLRLYNKCLASERLLFSKYKMKKKQKKKLKKMFNSLKNNALQIDKL